MILQQSSQISVLKLIGNMVVVCAMMNLYCYIDSLTLTINAQLEGGSEGVYMFGNKFLSMVLLVGMLILQSVPSALAADCDHAQFVSDLSVPDGSSFAPGATFTKT